MIRRSLAVVFAALIAVPALAFNPPWTAVGTTAVIDESSVSLYALTPPYLGFNASGTGWITAYFNVTDTTALASPGWNTLEMSFFDNSSQSTVVATLYAVHKCTGKVTQICKAVSVESSANACQKCIFTPAVDFATFSYYITARIYRANTGLAPKLFGVRVY